MPSNGLLAGPYREPCGAPRRRLLGTYYTPEDLATVLARWALVDTDGSVLDPSYGGCAFLEAAARVFSEDNPLRGGADVYGVDIDPRCAATARDSALLTDENCIEADFLAVSPDDLLGSPYAAIVGNPPYVRHHWIQGDQRESATAVAAESGVPLPATAGLWAYFIIHSLRFLSIGGRLAMLVPEAILQADYAAPLREMLGQRFENSRMIHIRDRQFTHTDEAVVALVCSGFGNTGTLQTLAVNSVQALKRILLPSRRHSQYRSSFPPAGDELEHAIALLNRIRETPTVRRLGDVASIRVGVVTGANKHFIRSKADLDALDIPSAARLPIVARTRSLEGLRFTRRDHEEITEAGAPAFLVRPDGSDDLRVARWIQEGEAQNVHERYKCVARNDWFRVDVAASPCAFATCARAGSPRMILNESECLNSNAVHSVNWNASLGVEPRAVAVAFLSSAVAVWAELRGRRYGGGVLKIEPGTLKRVPVPLLQGVEDIFEDVDRELRKGQEERARRLVDDRVLRQGLALNDREIEYLHIVRSRLMEWRRPSRGTTSRG